jgi:hypothetical protein
MLSGGRGEDRRLRVARLLNGPQMPAALFDASIAGLPQHLVRGLRTHSNSIMWTHGLAEVEAVRIISPVPAVVVTEAKVQKHRKRQA